MIPIIRSLMGITYAAQPMGNLEARASIGRIISNCWQTMDCKISAGII